VAVATPAQARGVVKAAGALLFGSFVPERAGPFGRCGQECANERAGAKQDRPPGQRRATKTAIAGHIRTSISCFFRQPVNLC